jgi:hypothetical protein
METRDEKLIPVTIESINKRITVQASLGKKQDPISKINRAKKTGGSGSNDRMPA